MLNIVIGNEAAGLFSFDTNTSQTIAAGEFAVFSTGKLSKQSGVLAATTKVLPVYAGNDVRFDTKALSKVTVATAKGAVFETDKFAAVSYNPGDQLSVADGKLCKVDGTNTVAVAYALSSATGGTLMFSLI